MKEEGGLFVHDINRELHEEVFHKTKESLSYIQFEIKKQLILAITAALVFLIALSWKEPIQDTFIYLIESIGWNGNELILEYMSAIVITGVAVIVLFIINSKIVKSMNFFNKKPKKKSK